MATLEDLGRMAMVEIDDDVPEFNPPPVSAEWGRAALLIAAGAAVGGLLVGLQRSYRKAAPQPGQ